MRGMTGSSSLTRDDCDVMFMLLKPIFEPITGYQRIYGYEKGKSVFKVGIGMKRHTRMASTSARIEMRAKA